MGIILKVLILGIVEGLTEFIPVSSTAHLLLVGNLIHVPNQLFLDTLSISIQAGAILAVVWYFWKTIWGSRLMIWKVAVAFIPTGIAGMLLYPHIKNLFSSMTVIAIALILGGIGLILIKPIESTDKVSTITWKQAFWIGCMQIFSFVPGVSRAGATLIGGTLLKIPRTLIIPFSFLLAIPTILGATVVSLKDMPLLSHTEWALLGFGMIVSFIVALFTIKFFINLLTKKPLSWFGWYRIAIAILILLFV